MPELCNFWTLGFLLAIVGFIFGFGVRGDVRLSRGKVVFLAQNRNRPFFVAFGNIFTSARDYLKGGGAQLAAVLLQCKPAGPEIKSLTSHWKPYPTQDQVTGINHRALGFIL